MARAAALQVNNYDDCQPGLLCLLNLSGQVQSVTLYMSLCCMFNHAGEKIINLLPGT